MHLPDLDHAGLFHASLNPYLVLDRRLHVVTANRAYLAATKRELSDIVGRWAWDAYPTGAETLKQSIASFERVIATKQPDTMALLRFDIPRPEDEGGGFEERYWSIVHSPVLDEHGEVKLVLQHPIDVTELQSLRSAMAPEEVGRVAPTHTGIFNRSASVHAQNLDLKAQCDQLQTLFQKTPGFMCVLSGPTHVFQIVNEAFRRLVGRSTLVGLPVREALPDIAGQGFYELLDDVHRTGRRHVAWGVPVRLQPSPAAGVEDRFVDFAYEPITGPDGTVSGIFVQGHDVTEGRAADMRLRESEAEAQGVLEGMGEGFLLLGPDFLIQRINAEGLRIDGRAAELIVGRHLLEVWPEAEHLPTWNMYRQAMSDRRPAQITYRHMSDEHDVWLEVRAYPSGEGLAVFYRDVTESQHAQEALRESEKRYRTLFDAIDAGFCVVEVMLDADGRAIDYRFVEANPAFGRQTGLQDAVGRTARELVPDLEPHWFETYGRIALTGEPLRFENGSDAMGRWFDVYALRVGEPQARRVAILFNDISARRNAEERLRELNATLEQRVAARTAERNQLWNLSEDMLAWADYHGMMSAVSPAWTRVLGWSEAELLSRPYALFMHPDDMDSTLAALVRMGETGEPTRFENRIATKDGAWKSIEWTVAPEPDGTNFIAVGRDVSLAREREAALEAAQEALRQSQKLEAMGQLTGGVAHDFNNLLTPIIGSLDMLTKRGIGNERERRLIDGALQSAERAKTLVQRLLAFARRQPLQPGPVDLRRLVGDMAELVASTSGPKVDVRVDMPEDLPPATADANQLEMAVLNLAVNARDAMPEGGALTISGSRESVRPGHPAKLRPGHYVRLSVSDTGVGMDEATLSRAIEPFFSTKGIGKGTGLGLSMVHGLASQLNGGLTIASRPGEGTTVTLWLPISAIAVNDDDRAFGDAAPQNALGTALLVDDEVLVRMSTADMLADLGYEVVEAGSAEEALRLIGEGLEPDLLVTDHLMPGLSGEQLARDLRLSRPNMPILVVSGYAEAAGIAPGLPRLTKPFRSAELAARVAALMPTGAG